MSISRSCCIPHSEHFTCVAPIEFIPSGIIQHFCKWDHKMSIQTLRNWEGEIHGHLQEVWFNWLVQPHPSREGGIQSLPKAHPSWFKPKLILFPRDPCKFTAHLLSAETNVEKLLETAASSSMSSWHSSRVAPPWKINVAQSPWKRKVGNYLLCICRCKGEEEEITLLIMWYWFCNLVLI